MPHLSFEYSSGLAGQADLNAFARALRDAMLASGVFPLGGIRVRGHCCDISVIADGTDGFGFIHMICSIGEGRTPEVQAEAAEVIYAAAEAWVQQHLGEVPLALSLTLQEMSAATSIKRYNTVKKHLG